MLIQVLEKLHKTDHRDIQIQTEDCNGAPISTLNYKNGGEHLKVFKQPILLYPVTLQELPNDRGSIRTEWTPLDYSLIWHAFTFCEKLNL